MVFAEVDLKRVVVKEILLSAAGVTTVAKMASFVLVAAMCVELIITVEPLPAETTFWMSFETALVYRTWVVVAKLFMLAQFSWRKEFMLVSEDFLIPRAQITKWLARHPYKLQRACSPHDLLVDALDVSMQIRPPITCNVAGRFWTIVA